MRSRALITRSDAPIPAPQCAHRLTENILRNWNQLIFLNMKFSGILDIVAFFSLDIFSIFTCHKFKMKTIFFSFFNYIKINAYNNGCGGTEKSDRT